MGFADGRNQNPNSAWKALLGLAKLGGSIDPTALRGCEWARNWRAVEKRMQAVRKILQERFKTD